jgi:hypothetical protein
MRTPVVAAVAAAIGCLAGVVAAVVIIDPDEQASGVSTTPDRPVDCASVISGEVLTALGWEDQARADERLGRCEWAGDAGNITAGPRSDTTYVEECDEASGRAGYQASTSWLEAPAITDGCVVVNEEGIGLYEVLAQQGDELVQVRVAVLEQRPVEDIREALRLLVSATAPAFE